MNNQRFEKMPRRSNSYISGDVYHDAGRARTGCCFTAACGPSFLGSVVVFLSQLKYPRRPDMVEMWFQSVLYSVVETLSCDLRYLVSLELCQS